MQRQFFTAQWCGACAQRKTFLNNKGHTDFELIDVGDNPAEYGLRSLPAFRIDGQPASWEQFLASFK